MEVILNLSADNEAMTLVSDGKLQTKDDGTTPQVEKEVPQQEMALPHSIHKEITPEKNQDGEANTTKEAESLVEPTDVNKNVDAAAATATLIKLGTTAATLENSDGFQTPNRRHQVSAAVVVEAATAMEGIVEMNHSLMALISLGTSRAWGASPTKSPNGN
jgi:hypothetical protein